MSASAPIPISWRPGSLGEAPGIRKWRRSLGILALLTGALLVGVPVSAQPGPAQNREEPSPNPAALLQEPGPFVTDVLTRVFTVLQDKSVSPIDLQQRIRALALASFDVDGITRFVAGSGWRSAAAEERQAFRTLLQDYVMQLYGSKVRAIDKAPSFAVSAVRHEGDMAYVTVEFPIPGAPPLHVDFRVARTPAGQKIADIAVVGISLVRTGRDEFAAVLTQNGNSLTTLMDIMRKHLSERAPT